MMILNVGTRFINKEKIKDKDMMITKNYIAKGEGANRFEKIPVQIYETADEAVKAVAREIVDLVQTKAASSEKCVLGLATGVSPIKLYQELVRMHREEGFLSVTWLRSIWTSICRCRKSRSRATIISCTTICLII